MAFRLVTHSDCLHLSNTQLRARQKTELLKLHNGLWCRVCAPYGYVPLSHLGNIVLTNEIATFHNGGISSSKCATLIISVFFLLQKIMKNVLSIPNNSAFIYLFNMLPKKNLHLHLKMTYNIYKIVSKNVKSLTYWRIYRSYIALSSY